jgi:hypothetical protein
LRNFVCYHGEALAPFAGAGGLDRRIYREDIGLFGKFVNHLGDASNQLGLLSEFKHVNHDDIDLGLDARDGLGGTLHGLVAAARRQ